MKKSGNAVHSDRASMLMSEYFAKDVLGKAYDAVVTSAWLAGLKLRIVDQRDFKRHQGKRDDNRLNVELRDGIVVSAWAG